MAENNEIVVKREASRIYSGITRGFAFGAVGALMIAGFSDLSIGFTFLLFLALWAVSGFLLWLLLPQILRYLNARANQ